MPPATLISFPICPAISAGVFVVGLILELCLPKDPKRYETR